jgi:hypothetical protein
MDDRKRREVLVAIPRTEMTEKPAMFCSLLQTHPNDLKDLNRLPGLNWSPDDPINFIRDNSVPDHLRDLLHLTSKGHRNRDPISLPPCTLDTTGMSPKKAHEVARMIAYLKFIYLPTLARNVRVVDVGSGQCYLCRAMAEHLDVNVLGIDGNVVQTDGAQKWSDGRRGRKKKRGTTKSEGKVDYITAHVTTQSLIEAVDQWIGPDESTDVVLVALHACGSLTPSIIRACFASTPSRWKFVGAVVVGCCYNLLHRSDFPLSQEFSSATNERAQELGINLHELPTCAFHLATQTPHRWNDTPETQRKARLAIRKIVFRALWGRCTAQAVSSSDGLGEAEWSQRLGRLNDRVYDSWEQFVQVASEKTGLPVTEHRFNDEEARRLEILHVLRCEAGRTIEDIILDDREAWVNELLKGERQVEMVNLFDQRMGSPRNVAIVV